MSKTTHEIEVKWTSNTKELEQSTARVAKDANKLSRDQKKTFGESFKKQKEQQKISGPREQKKMTQELKTQNKELQSTNRLLGTQLTIWQKIARIAGGAGGIKKRQAGGGGGPPPIKPPKGGKGNGPNDPPNNPPGPNGKGGGGGAGSAMLRLAGGALAYLATLPFQAINNDYSAAFNNRRAMGGLTGFGRGAPFGVGLTDKSILKSQHAMAEWGYSPEETLSGTRAFARATGSSKFTERGMANAKMLGMGSEEVAGIFGDIRQGSGSFGEKGMKDFQRILAAGVKSGVDASTLPEYFEGISSLVNRAGGAAGGSVSTLPYAQILAMFEKSGSAGLKGARGASVASALEEGFKAPGGGDEGLGVVMGSLGYGRAGGNASYYEAKKMMQQGFQSEDGTGAKRLKGLFDYVDNITGGGEESNLYMEGLMGGRLSLDQIEKVRGALDKGSSSKEVEDMMAEMTASELDVLHSVDNSLKEILHGSSRSAKLQMEDIDRGERDTATVEAFHDMMQEFLNETQPLMLKVLQDVLLAFQLLKPGVDKLVEILNHFYPDSATDVVSRGTSYNTASDDLEVAAEEIASLGTGASDVELGEGIRHALDASRLRLEAPVDNLDAVASEVFHAVGTAMGEDMAPTIADSAVAASAADIRRAADMLAVLAERQGITFANRADVDTQPEFAEAVRALTALGLNIPSGPRGTVDTTGGAP